MSSAQLVSSLFGEGAVLLPNPLISGLFFFALAILPVFALAVTSFVKVSVVLGVLRSAVGAGQVPSGSVIAVLSMVLTLHIMGPVAEKMWTGFQGGIAQGAPGALKNAQQTKLAQVECPAEQTKHPVGRIVCAVKAAVEPLREFLVKFSGGRERKFFADLSAQNGGSGAERELTNLLPAFMISELHAAFKIGLVVYLPFLIVDLVITNILVALGMTMVNPISITLPVKLLLFVSSNGWFLLCRGLVLSYG